MGISGKVVAITGASSGIGEATARELAARGASVVLGARRVDRLEQLAADIEGGGGQARAVRVDVTDPTDLEQLVTTAVEDFGRLDVLVGNAGISTIAPLADGDLANWSAMVDVNIKGVLHGIAAALPIFRRQGSGHLVTVVSTSGIKIVPTQAVYSPSGEHGRNVAHDVDFPGVRAHRARRLDRGPRDSVCCPAEHGPPRHRPGCRRPRDRLRDRSTSGRRDRRPDDPPHSSGLRPRGPDPSGSSRAIDPDHQDACAPVGGRSGGRSFSSRQTNRARLRKQGLPDPERSTSTSSSRATAGSMLRCFADLGGEPRTIVHETLP